MALAALNPSGDDRNRNPQTEQFLRSRHVKFDLITKVSIANIDVEGSLRNQARLGTPLNDENVRKIREALRTGVRTPPILVKKKADGKYLVLDGNHRVAAHQEEELPIDVYECEARDEILTLIMYEANTLHGLPTNEEDRTAAAMFLVDQGFGIKDAAEKMLVSVAAVRREVAKVDADRRAAKAQIDPRLWEKLPDATRQKLIQLRTDEAFEAMARLVVDANMKADAVVKFVTELNRETSINMQLEMIAAKRDDLVDDIEVAVGTGGGNGRKGKRSPKSRINMAAGQLLSLGDPILIASSIPMTERDSMLQKVRESQTFLSRLQEALSA